MDIKLDRINFMYKKYLKEIMYIISLVLYFFQATVGDTMLTYKIPSVLIMATSIISLIGFLSIILLFNHYSIFETVCYSILFILCVAILIQSRYSIPLEMLIILISSKEISFKKIIRTYFFSQLFLS